MFLFKKRSLYSTQRAERTRRRLFYSVFFSALFLVAGIFLAARSSYWEKVSIVQIKISGAESIPKEEIRALVQGKIQGAYLSLFNRASSFLYPRKEIEKSLSLAFPRMANVAVSLERLREIQVDVEERVPSYLWCGSTLNPAEGLTTSGEYLSSKNLSREQCYFIDPQGVIFTEAPHFSGNVYFEMYGDISGKSVFSENAPERPIGFFFLPTQDFERIIALKNELANSGIIAEKFIVENEERDAAFVFPNGIRLLFNLNQDFGILVYNLLAAFDTEPLKKEMLYKNEPTLRYIDARFENRIFYK